MPEVPKPKRAVRPAAPVFPRSDPRWVDPGPPPKIPKEPENIWPFGLSPLTGAALARDRAGLEAFNCLNFPPSVGSYRAHLLEWLDAMEAYEAAKGKA